MDILDKCPKCGATDEETEHNYLGAYNVCCGECGHEWNLRVQWGLSPDYCECCGRRLSWGCGHTPDQEVESVTHRQTLKHFEGECACFTARPGYIPPKVPNTLYPTLFKWREHLSKA